MKHINLRKISMVMFIVTFPLCGSAQNGSPYITNYSLYTVIDRHHHAIEEGADHMMFFANPKGILTFDGELWEFIPLEKPPLALCYDSLSKTMYTGSDNDFGCLKRDLKGKYTYQSLSGGASGLGLINRIELVSDGVYFSGLQSVISIGRFDKKLRHQWKADQSGSFAGISHIGKKVYVYIESKGFYLLDEQKMTFACDFPEQSRSGILFSVSVGARTILVSNKNGYLFLFNGSKLTSFSIKDSTYYRQSIPVSAHSIKGNRVALSTLIGGCLVVDRTTGETVATLNFNTGLPDDEIYAIGVDRNNGLWLSQAYGLSRVDLNLPVRQYNYYPGINGNLTSVCNLEGNIYVGTSEGIYLLKEIREFTTHEVKVKIKTPTPPKSSKNIHEESVKSETSATGTEQETTKSLSKREQRKLEKLQEKQPEAEEKPVREGFLARIFKTSSQPKKETITQPEQDIKQQQQRFRKEKTYILQSVTHRYEKIPGLDEKCRQLVNVTDRLLAATNTGLYEVVNQKARPVLKDHYIYFIERSLIPDRFFIGTDAGVYSIMLRDGRWETENTFTEIPGTVYSLTESSPNVLWMGSDNTLYQVTTDVLGKTKDVKSFSIESQFSEQVNVKYINHKLMLFLSSGVYEFSNETLRPAGPVTTDFLSVPVYLFSDKSLLWIRYADKWTSMADTATYNTDLNLFLNLFDEIQYISYDENGDLWVIHHNNRLTRIVSSDISQFVPDFSLYIKQIKDEKGILSILPKVEVKYENSSVEFRMIAPYFVKENSTQYQYWLEGLTDAWSPWSTSSLIQFPVVPPGRYTLHVRARNVLGKVSPETTIDFRVKPPFWQSAWFLALVVVALCGLVWMLIRLQVKKLEHDKKVLEQKVKERTIEIENQKEEIRAQRDELAERNEEIMQQKEEIEAQRDEIESQRDKIAFQNKEITDSIVYAKRIQTAVMPSDSLIRDVLPDSFIFWRPRNIVSGDFYWATRKDGKTVIAAADCTGHGVPGAFMSMLGVSFLNEIVHSEKTHTAGEILNELRFKIKATLAQHGRMDETKDGMDMALCIIDAAEKTMDFAGAFNPLIFIRNDELIEYKGDKMPVGIYIGKEENFTDQKITIQKGDTCYIFSDGFKDQFGGPGGKKFSSKPFKDLLLSIHKHPMPDQREYLVQTIDKWMHGLDQVDDMMVIGFRI